MIKSFFSALLSVLCFVLGSAIVWAQIQSIHTGVVRYTNRAGTPHIIRLADSPAYFWIYISAAVLFGLILMLPAFIVVKQAITGRNPYDKDEDF